MPYYPVPDAIDPDPTDARPDREPIDSDFERPCDIAEALVIDLGELSGNNREDVIRLVSSYLERAFLEPGNKTLAIRLEDAWWSSVGDRRKISTTNDALRDASRYLYGLHSVASGNVRETAAITGAPIYEGLKFIAHKLKDNDMPALEYAIREDENPTSKPSVDSVRYAYRGLSDGLPLFENRDRKVSVKRGESPPWCRDVRDMRLRKD